VQQARLQLHPAEMGPITVQIALDGASARVDFHAAVAATRQALEAALPALAGALRESGLTLTGGGVYQQAPGRQDADSGPGGGSPDGRAPGRQASDDGPAPLMALPLRRRGLVDLVA
jgi:flagellar hook-length control protein FliK